MPSLGDCLCCIGSGPSLLGVQAAGSQGRAEPCVQHSPLLHGLLAAKGLQRRSTQEWAALLLCSAKKHLKELMILGWCCTLLRCLWAELSLLPWHLCPGLAPPLFPPLTWCHQHHPGPAGQQTLPAFLSHQQLSEPLASQIHFSVTADIIRG